MPGDCREAAHSGPEVDNQPRGDGPERGEIDRWIVAVAEQHGVITLRQLVGLGLGRRAVRWRVSSGRLHPIHRGIYAVGRRDLTIKGRWIAAVVACGDGAALSHRPAATLHGLIDARGGRIDVSIPRQSSLRRPGLRVHRSTCLCPSDCTTVERIPCTGVPVTLLALAATSPTNIVESACNQAEIKEVLNMQAVEELLERRRSHPGVDRLRGTLEAEGFGLDRTKSHLEHRFLRLVREAGLPAPTVNDSIAIPGEEMQFDFVWHRERLVVEVDGWETHRTRKAFHDDRRRDQLLQAAGWSVLRFTDRDFRSDPDHVVRTVCTLLERDSVSRAGLPSGARDG
jgi:very-short-patch-repair endonuclease